MASVIHYLPNGLTYLRLLLVPVFVLLMIDPAPGMVYIATLIFVFASLTDYLDGYIARAYSVVSDTGKLLDPLADKILVMAALVMLVAQRSDIDGAPWVPAWMVVLLLARELWVTGLRAVAAGRGVVMGASQSGKIKSLFQMAAIALLLLHYPVRIFGVVLSPQLLGVNLLLVSLAFSLWSAGEYTWLVLGAAQEVESKKRT